MPTRINKYLAKNDVCSRREADEMVRAGRVTVNGEPAQLGSQVSGSDHVEVDGSPIRGTERRVYLKFHKPRGVTTTTDSRDPDNIIGFINFPTRIFPVGRLDKFSTGLILLTNDGAISDRILRPANHHEKEYAVRLDRPYGEDFRRAFERGVELDGRPTLSCKVERMGKRAFRVVITEGRNRQIRRMCECLGYSVVALRRTRIMHIVLDRLPVGEWRELSSSERDELFHRLDLSDPSARG